MNNKRMCRKQEINVSRNTNHLYLKKWPSIGLYSVISSEMRDLSARFKSTYGVNSHPTMGISDGKCTRSTVSILPSYSSSSSSPSTPSSSRNLKQSKLRNQTPALGGLVADPPSPNRGANRQPYVVVKTLNKRRKLEIQFPTNRQRKYQRDTAMD